MGRERELPKSFLAIWDGNGNYQKAFPLFGTGTGITNKLSRYLGRKRELPNSFPAIWDGNGNYQKGFPLFWMGTGFTKKLSRYSGQERETQKNPPVFREQEFQVFPLRNIRKREFPPMPVWYKVIHIFFGLVKVHTFTLFLFCWITQNICVIFMKVLLVWFYLMLTHR